MMEEVDYDENFPGNAPYSLQKERYSICKSCEHLDRSKNRFMCRLCSCFMPVKTSLLDSTCPIHKW